MTQSTGARTDARAALLDRVVNHLSEHGSSDLTLRGVAQAVGSSHRMVIYHFGSLDGLLTAVVSEVEQRQRDLLAGLVTDPGLGLAGLTEALWVRIKDGRLRPFERLFFELYGRALASGDPDLGDRLVRSWLTPAEDLLVARGLDPATAAALSRLGLALTRGLLLDLLATGDEGGVDAAMRLYLQQLEQVDRSLPSRD